MFHAVFFCDAGLGEWETMDLHFWDHLVDSAEYVFLAHSMFLHC